MFVMAGQALKLHLALCELNMEHLEQIWYDMICVLDNQLLHPASSLSLARFIFPMAFLLRLASTSSEDVRNPRSNAEKTERLQKISPIQPIHICPKVKPVLV